MLDCQKELEDLWNTAFEAGVAYTFGHIDQDKFNPHELSRFADWIELKCPWKTYEEWYKLIVTQFVNLTPERYEMCKKQYRELREVYKDNPSQLKYYTEAEAKLDKQWKSIQETGTYTLDIPKISHEIIVDQYEVG